MEHLTLVKILTPYFFTPQKDYFFTQGKEHLKVRCEKQTEGGWYFSTEEDYDSLIEMNGRLSSDNGVLKTNTLEIKELRFLESRMVENAE